MRRTRASNTQLNYLSEYMGRNPEMAKGPISASLQARVEIEKKWFKLTHKLNSLGGSVKNVAKWKQTWRDLKCGVRRKSAPSKKELSSEGSGSTCNSPPALLNLDPVEVDSDDSNETKEFKININLGSDEPGPSDAPMPVLCSTSSKPPLDPSDRPQKTNRQNDSRHGNLEKSLIEIEKEKLKVKKEKNLILQSKNEALHRLADILEDISKKLLK